MSEMLNSCGAPCWHTWLLTYGSRQIRLCQPYSMQWPDERRLPDGSTLDIQCRLMCGASHRMLIGAKRLPSFAAHACIQACSSGNACSNPKASTRITLCCCTAYLQGCHLCVTGGVSWHSWDCNTPPGHSLLQNRQQHTMPQTGQEPQKELANLAIAPWL